MISFVLKYCVVVVFESSYFLSSAMVRSGIYGRRVTAQGDKSHKNRYEKEPIISWRFKTTQYSNSVLLEQLYKITQDCSAPESDRNYSDQSR